MIILILYSAEGGSRCLRNVGTICHTTRYHTPHRVTFLDTNVRTTNLTFRVVVLLVNGELERILKAQILV